MFENNQEQQKSPKRRFLLILGALAFVLFLAFGLMLIFWSKFLAQLGQPQRTLFGIVVIIYAFLRFSRLLRKDPNEL